MNRNEKSISNLKHFILYNTINRIDNKIFYNSMDEALVKKRFNNAYDLSTNEHIFKIDMLLLTNKDVIKIVSDFIKTHKNKNILTKRNLYELLKISNLPQNKLSNLYNGDKILNLVNALEKVSRETVFISFDFLILRVLDNLIRKSSKTFKYLNYMKQLHSQIIEKLINFDYKIDEKETETNYLCWIDRLLSSVVEKEISTNDFKVICNKIINTTTHTIYLYWKILNSVNYLLLQRDFSSQTNLRFYKTELEKIIETKYSLIELTCDELKDLTISTLAKSFPVKEDFYYLFDSIAIVAMKSSEDKKFCLELCQYIIYYDTKYNIFSYRFIRKYFIEMIFKFIRSYDNIDIKNIELLLLIKLFHVDHFFSFYKKEIFFNILNILKNISTYHNNLKLTNKNFYKYCDIVDYILYTNDDLDNINIIEYLCENKEISGKIIKHLQLQKLKH
ncbi:MAG: hypothetical protein IKW39_03505 [Alphaproteobacteria bacterium]|nr:hypothetical protein [Alphaproteobacteria bacterium]